MTRATLLLDISTAPIADAATYLEGAISAPSNYKDPDKIAAYIAEKQAERLDSAALDIDLARVTGIATCIDGVTSTTVLKTEAEEIKALASLGYWLRGVTPPTIVTYGGFNFDLPMLQRRARYLGVSFPSINLDRYRSPHVDLCELLSDRNPSRRRPLAFYVRRMGWTDLVKPLSGAEEGQVFQSGKWAELEASLLHDITATKRLAQWAGVTFDAEMIPA